MKRKRPAVAGSYSFLDRLEAAFVTVAWLLPPFGIYWLVINRFLADTPWLLSGEIFLDALAAAAILGFTFPRAVPRLVGSLWDGIMSLGRYWY
jgi:hypothetical protein